MVDQPNITDEKSLSAWLESWPRKTEAEKDQLRKVARILATRAAMRLVRMYWQWTLEDYARNRDYGQLGALRLALILDLHTRTNADGKHVGPLANTSFTQLGRTPPPYNNIAFSLIKTGNSYTSTAIGTVMDEAVDAITQACNIQQSQTPLIDLWQMVQNEAQHYLTSPKWEPLPLFYAEGASNNVWPSFKNRLAQDDYDWSFWIDWYERILKGGQYTPEYIAQLTDIAKIPDAVWKDAAKAGQAINEILGKPIHIAQGVDSEPETDQAEQKLIKLTEQIEAAGKRQNALDDENKQLRIDVKTHKDAFEQQATKAKESIEKLTTDYQEKLEALESSMRAEHVIRAPVALWEEKQKEHEGKMKWALGFFCGGLVAIVVLVGFSIWYGSGLNDPANTKVWTSPHLTKIVGTLTILTVFLWFTRLQMKVYLSERHLTHDARERRAFAQAYVGFLKEPTTTEETTDQRAIVYTALFRPTNDGMVRDDGGLDPSVTAALSKFLSR